MSRPAQTTVLFVHPSDELYGADRCLLDIIVGLPSHFRPIVVLPTDIDYGGALSAELAGHGVPVVRIDMLVLRRSILKPRSFHVLLKRLFSGVWEIGKLCHHHQVNIVHSNTVAVPCGAIAAAMTGTPHVWHVHEHIGDEPRPLKAMVRSMLGVLPGRIVANSKATARALVAGSRRRARKTRVIYNGVRLPAERSGQLPQVCARTARIVVIGRLSPRKGVAEALRAATLMKERGIGFEMVFVGGAPPGSCHYLHEYQQLARLGGLDDEVHFAGEQPNPAQILKRADILLAPSQRPEGFGMTVIEAMAHQVPVVATRNGGGDELIEQLKTGLYCEADPGSIADGLQMLIENPALRYELAGNAARQVRLRFSIERYQEQFVILYQNIQAGEYR